MFRSIRNGYLKAYRPDPTPTLTGDISDGWDDGKEPSVSWQIVVLVTRSWQETGVLSFWAGWSLGFGSSDANADEIHVDQLDL